VRRLAAVVLFLLALAASSRAEDDLPALREIVEPKAPLSKRIYLVLDTSGSMKPHMGDVMKIVRAIVGQPLDEFEIAVGTFDNRPGRWPGVPEADAHRPVPPGWARLPSADALKLAETWLQHEAPKGGGTEPEVALKAALAEPRADLSIVYVTDGEYTAEDVMKAIRQGQAARKAKGLGEAVIAVYGIVLADASYAEHLRVVATEGRGGMWVPEQGKAAPENVAPVKTW
jgi:hypothetical protein